MGLVSDAVLSWANFRKCLVAIYQSYLIIHFEPSLAWVVVQNYLLFTRLILGNDRSEI